MKHDLKRYVIVAAAAASVGLAACAVAPVASAQQPAAKSVENLNPPGPTDPLTILSGGKSYPFQVEFADTPAKSEMGLMYRASMAKDHGMIFDFGEPKQTGMWMKNCYFAQDMLFLDTDGTVLAIAENARPGSVRIIDPGFPVKGVLELNAGIVKEIGIKPGDKIQHKMFKVAAAAPATAAPKASAKPKSNGG